MPLQFQSDCCIVISYWVFHRIYVWTVFFFFLCHSRGIDGILCLWFWNHIALFTSLQYLIFNLRLLSETYVISFCSVFLFFSLDFSIFIKMKKIVIIIKNCGLVKNKYKCISECNCHFGGKSEICMVIQVKERENFTVLQARSVSS